MEFGLFCDKEFVPTVIKALIFVAKFLGAAIAGYLSDTFGRRRTVMGGLIVANSAGLVLRFMPRWEAFIVFWVIIHASAHLAYIAASVWVIEVVGPTKRHFGQLISIGFGVGYMLTSALAYGFPHWKNFTSSEVVLVVPVLIVIYFLPQSPRWEYLNSNPENGLRVLQLIATKGNVELPTELHEQLVNATSDSTDPNKTSSNGTIIDVFRSRHFRKIAFVMGFAFIGVTCAYYGYDSYGMMQQL